MVAKVVSVRLVAQGGDQVKRQLADVGAAGARASQQIGSSASRMGPQVQNAAFQIGDFAVQVESGTSATRALTQQLPQLLGGFGVAGAVVGGLVAVFGALAPVIFASGEEAKSATERLEDLAKATDEYARAAELAVSPTDKLIERYGKLADEVRRAQIAEAEAARDRALRAIQDTFEEFGSQSLLSNFSAGQIAGVDAAEMRVDQLYERVQRLQGSLTADQAQFFDFTEDLREIERVRERIEDIRQGVQDFADALGTTPVQAQALAIAFAEVEASASGSAAEQVAAATELRDLLVDTYGSIEEANQATDGLASALNKAVIEAANIASIDMVSPISDAAAAAGDLVRALSSAQAAVATFQQQNDVYSGRGQDPRLFTDPARFNPSQDIIDAANEMLRPSRRGGGGGSRESDAAREAKRIFEETRTEAEKYAAELTRVNDLHRSGALDTETYNRKVAQLKEEYGDQTGLLADVASAVKGNVGSIFDTIGEGSEAAIKSLRDLGEELAKPALNKLFTQLLGNLFPNVFGAGGSIALNAEGNAFMHGRVTAFATGGVVSSPTLFGMRGGLGLMGEAGPEAILPLQRIGGRLGVAAQGGGGTQVNIIDQRQGGAQIETRRERGPDGREIVTAIVRDEMARGGFDGAQRGRFGARPKPVKR